MDDEKIEVCSELFLDVRSSEVNIALLNNKRLVELSTEYSNVDFSVGDIYLGRVNKLMPGLNAAFIDVGYRKDAFLHYLDLGSGFMTLKKFVRMGMTQNPNGLTNIKVEPDIDKRGKISDLLKVGEYVLVQVAKEPISSKGPRLTCEISIAGRNLVLLPFNNRISVRGVNFILMENFDQIGSKFEKSDSSTYGFDLSNDGGYDGYAMKVVIPKDDYSGYFECRASDVYSISENGETYLEISYKCNDKFNFGMFGVVESATSTSGVRENVYTFYPTDGKWKRVYINLNRAIINSSSNCGQFQPFFTAVRVDTISPVGQNTEIYIDNLKLLHLEN